MKRGSQKMAVTMIAALVLNSSSIAFASPTAAPSSLIQSIKTLKATVDSGVATPEQAIDSFAKSIAEQNLSLEDVKAYAKKEMSPEAFQAFTARVDDSLHGMDTSKLSSDQLGQVVGEALAQVHSEGLYWSGCAQVWTGAAIIAAAVVVGIVAILKSKSQSAIQADYQKQLADQKAQDENNISGTRDSYNSSIANTRNWKNSYPTMITNDQGAIANDRVGISADNNQIGNDNGTISQDQYLISQHQATIDELNYELANQQIDQASYDTQYNDLTTRISNDRIDISNLQSDVDSLVSDVNSRNNDINNEVTNIQNLQNAIQRYTADPSLAEADAQSLAVQRDSALENLANQEATDLANLQANEAAAIAKAPDSQALGRSLGIGAGVGAAIAGVLIVHGIHDGVDCGGH